jgi:predicted MFS family arabinose efflux permease
MLSLIMLINRSGTMVLPFLSVYLTQSLGFSVEKTGIVLSSYGFGSMTGAYLGGILTDRIGHFRVQFLSLIISGFCYVALSFITDYYQLMAGFFLTSMIAESLRPANASSISFYAKPENIARSFSLNRMAINLGFSVGPLAGGLLATLSYKMLFYVDGITCALAGVVFFLYFKNRKGHQPSDIKLRKDRIKIKTAYSDKRYLTFILLSSVYAILFFQLFMTLPLYYREIYGLREKLIGGLLAINGFAVFSIEMILVYILSKRYRLHWMIVTGMILLGISFAMLNLSHSLSLLVFSMLILSISEIFAMPFMATYIVDRSNPDNRGSYMGLYSMSFSIALILAPYLGSKIISNYGFETLWWGTGIIAILIAIGFYFVTRFAYQKRSQLSE